MQFRDLRADEIDVRIGQVNTDYGYITLLLYKDARVDMNILDESVGSENWQRRHYSVKDNMYCSVGIKVGNEWVWKDDCGTESNTEKEKGESSDSFKRACVNWGIGRELYTAPQIKTNCLIENKKPKNLSNFKVARIVIENKEIIELEISAYDRENRTTETVFTYAKKGVKKAQNQLQMDSESVDNKENKKPLTLAEAENMTISTESGDIKLKNLTIGQLERLLKNGPTPEYQEAARLILEFKAQ